MSKEAEQVEYAVFRGEEYAEDALAIREAVFVEEQDVAIELERDGLDGESEHIVGYLDEQPVTVARIRKLPDGMVKIERVATVEERRGLGIGTDLMRQLLGDLKERGVVDVTLNAQAGTESFYESLGFQQVGEAFEEAGMSHMRMDKQLQPRVYATGSFGSIVQ